MSLQVEGGTLRFHSLSFLPEGGEVVVGRTDVDSYGVFPDDGAALLQELVAGRATEDAAQWYSKTYGEDVDMAEFVETLRELDFLRVDDVARVGPVRWQRLGRAMFSPPAWCCYALLVAVAVVLLVLDPRLLPSRQHIFFSPYLLVIEVTLFCGQLPLSMWHEMFHVLAGRRLGLPCRTRVGRRFYLLVFETAIDGLVVVPRRKRYLPMLAGMLADLLGMSVLTIVAYLTREPDGTISLVGHVCLALVLTSVLRVVWQFYFFMRTDIYYLVTTVLGCVDLHGTSSAMIGNGVKRLLGRRDRLIDPENWHPRDRQVAKWYAPLHVAGYAVMLAVLVFAIVPIGWQFLTTAMHTLLSGDARPARLADAAAMLVINVSQLAFAAFLAVRERRGRGTLSSQEKNFKERA
ncbi:hypothetical protein [Fodinicola feengrottensis]|uniref:PqqD family peptide modification chaperone n=1 Tax=Fodinicola feengrottensis TaxID=435914 RepID=A0ABP4TJM5_9ACTN|nr:hypothetical protein [Fodinicola feengrottensis]